MKDYNEITKSLLERRERYFAQRRKNSRKLAGVIVPVVGVSVVALAVFGAFKGNEFKSDMQAPIIESLAETVVTQVESQLVAEDNVTTTKDDTNGKVNSNSNKNNQNNKGEEIATDTQEGQADEYYTEGGKPGPFDKNHNNNKDQNGFIDESETQESIYEDRYVNRIEVTQLPLKTTYYVGETIDLRGIEVMAYFSNGDVEDVAQDIQFHYDGVLRQATDRYGVMIEYTDKSEVINVVFTTFYVKVLPAPTDADSEIVAD